MIDAEKRLHFTAYAKVLRSPPGVLSHTLTSVYSATFGECEVKLHPAGDVLWIETQRGEYIMIDVDILAASVLIALAAAVEAADALT